MASEYGWTDEQIGDLYIVRLRQIVSAIRLRQFVRTREENARFSWLARSLGTLIAAGYQTEGENPAIDHAANLSIDEIEAAALKDATGVGEARAAQENGPGSFEKLMQYMGGPPR